MSLYILLSTLTAEGSQRLHSEPDRLQQVNDEIQEVGCKVVAEYATMGPFDFVTVIEAPDNESAALVSAGLKLARNRQDHVSARVPGGRLPGAPEVPEPPRQALTIDTTTASTVGSAHDPGPQEVLEPGFVVSRIEQHLDGVLAEERCPPGIGGVVDAGS